jgi:hypothetical protein
MLKADVVGPLRADLFLNGPDAVNSHIWIQTAFRFQEAQGFGHDQNASLVVEGACRCAVAQQMAEFRLDRNRVSKRDDLLGFRFGSRSNVDPEVLDCRLLFLLIGRLQVHRFAADNAGNSLPSVHPDTLPVRNCAVISANGAEMQKKPSSLM